MYSILSSFLGQEQAMLITLMLTSIPISLLLSKLNNKYAILAISIFFSVLFQNFMFPTEKYFLWVQQHIVYLLLKFGPRKSIGKIILIESFIFLSIIQIRRMYIAYAINGVDITGILMMQTFLYVGLAYNYQNGLKTDEELSESANKRKVNCLPDYLTYMGFVFFLPSCLVGPVFEFRDFEDYLNRKGDYTSIPNTLKPAARELMIFLFALAVYFSTSVFALSYTVSPEFMDHSYSFKILYICGSITNIEFKYITAWSLGMISVHSSGLSYSKSHNDFSKICVTKLKGFFLDPSLKVKIDCWNISVQVALKRYIYEQTYDSKAVYSSEKARKRAQAVAQRNTLLASALWHGFYPGYFMSFFQWMIYLRMTQELFRLRKINKSVDNLWTKYHFGIVENLTSHFVFLYFGVFFHVMTFENILSIFQSTYAIPFIFLYGLYFVIYEAEMLSKPKKQKNVVSESSSDNSAPESSELSDNQKEN